MTYASPVSPSTVCAASFREFREEIMRRRDVLCGTAALASTLALAGGAPIPAFAQTTLKASDVHPPGYPTVAAVESVGTIGPVIDDLNVFNLPFLFRNTAHMQKVIDGALGSELLDKVTANEKAGLVGLCWMDAGARSFYNTKHPIKSIADLKGLKVRVIGNPMFVDMANALGANGVAMGYDQVFSALQTGVIDGAENNPPSFVFD